MEVGDVDNSGDASVGLMLCVCIVSVKVDEMHRMYESVL